MLCACVCSVDIFCEQFSRPYTRSTYELYMNTIMNTTRVNEYTESVVVVLRRACKNTVLFTDGKQLHNI